MTSLRGRPAPWLAAAVVALGLGLVALAADLARPYDPGTSPRVLALGWLLVPLVGVTAYLSTRWAWLASAGVVAPQLLAGVLAVREARAEGRTGGWELFVAEVAWGVVGFALLAVVVGALVRYAPDSERESLNDPHR